MSSEGYCDRTLLCDERLDRRCAIGGETEAREYGRHHEEDRGAAGNVQEIGLCRVRPNVEESIEIRYWRVAGDGAGVGMWGC